VVAEEPRLGTYLERMEARIAELLAIPVERVNVKVTSTDGLGTLGRGEGIAALAVVLLDAEAQA
jgi:2-C-methyl-D-erythritol 2,4-cyclodiphosphate synthase